MSELGTESKDAQGIRDKVEDAHKAIREAKLVVCVRFSMGTGLVVCPIIELCPLAPKENIADHLYNDLSYSRLSYLEDSDAFDDERTLEELVDDSISDVMGLLEKAKEISANCPLRKTLEGHIETETHNTESELGPGSKALLDRINTTPGFIEQGTLISWAMAKSGLSHTDNWWYRRLVALALEGHIEAKVYRTGDDVAIKFRRKKGLGEEAKSDG